MPDHRTLLIRSLTDWTATAEAARPVPAWSDDPRLAGCPSPAEAAARAAADPAVFSALAARRGDQRATAAALAVVAARLAPIVGRWARAGLAGDDLADAEADLVAEALTALHADPTRPPAVLAQVAWHRVEAVRRTARSRADRHVPLGPAHDRVSPSPEPARPPLGLIGEALAAGVLTASTVAVLWVECGLPVTAGPAPDGPVSPAAWRQRRSRARRAVRALAASGGL